MSTAMTTPSSIHFEELAFGQLFTTSKGAKQVPATYKNGEPVAFHPSDQPLDVPFEPSAFGDAEASRVTLCLTPPEEVRDLITALDEWCIATISENPTDLLGVSLTPEQVRERYVSCLKTSDKGYKTLRCKMNKVGRYALQCYDADRKKRDMPESWRGCCIVPRLVFKGLYVMGKDFGPIVECTHGIVFDDIGHACPF